MKSNKIYLLPTENNIQKNKNNIFLNKIYIKK